MANKEAILGKKITLIEKAQLAPFEVIVDIIGGFQEVWLKKQLESWLVLALIGETPYGLSPERKMFGTFYGKVKKLLPQFSIVFNEMEKDVNWPQKNTVELKKFKHKWRQFFKEFPIIYVRRELRDWLFAGLLYDGVGDLKFEPYLLFLVSQDLQALLEAAWAIIKE